MEEKDVQRLLDMLYSMISDANRAAFSADRCVIDREEALELLDSYDHQTMQRPKGTDSVNEQKAITSMVLKLHQAAG